ncbi:MULTISPECIES: hypothetical protein [unclassified Nocardioides]|uniref:hypothetical protein n=1 Tax=unclassified Nocardioides TaxID=2615069 RepID=UPI0036239D42
MGISELVDASAATALTHALELQQHLRGANSSDPAVTECRDEVHRLVADIVSLRNATELLKRELARAS